MTNELEFSEIKNHEKKIFFSQKKTIFRNKNIYFISIFNPKRCH